MLLTFISTDHIMLRFPEATITEDIQYENIDACSSYTDIVHNSHYTDDAIY